MDNTAYRLKLLEVHFSDVKLFKSDQTLYYIASASYGHS